jgi:hypothetical protein
MLFYSPTKTKTPLFAGLILAKKEGLFVLSLPHEGDQNSASPEKEDDLLRSLIKKRAFLLARFICLTVVLVIRRRKRDYLR